MAAAPIMDKAASGMRDLLSAFSSSEARYFDEERYSEAQIRKALSDNLTDKKIDAMKQTLAAMSLGRDASALFPDVVKNVSFQSLELKRLIYIYLIQYAENNRDLALLSINSFQKDLSDRSQLVRASALRAMASIKVLEVIQLVMVAVKTASNDSSPYVRKATAQCITKVYGVDPDQFLELRALLLKLMSDSEVVVVSSAVIAFHQICVLQPPKVAAEGGGHMSAADVVKTQLELLHPHFRRLCKDVLLMDGWAQQSCVDLLVRYCRTFFANPDVASAEKPAEVSEDHQAVLRVLKLLLSSSSSGVILAAIRGICYIAPAADMSTVPRPLLRCLRQAPPESVELLLASVVPVVEARPELLRSSIRDFLVQSFDFPKIKELKLRVLELLVDATNVQLVLKELQTYVTWQSQPKFVQQAVQSIAAVARKVPTVADACLRGLVKMLDSKSDALSCEAVVSLRTLLQQRERSKDNEAGGKGSVSPASGLGSVLPHLVHHIGDLSAPSARASVVWIIGHYQHEVPRLAPDVVRQLAKTFSTERLEVKQQVLGLALKVWAYHMLNASGHAIPAGGSGDDDADADSRQRRQLAVTPEESLKLLPRLEGMTDYVCSVASYDASWDVRDMARALQKLKAAAKAESTNQGSTASPLQKVGALYCRTCLGLPAGEDAAAVAPATTDALSDESMKTTWMLGSLAQALDFPLDSYKPLPAWATENSPDELRKVKVEAPKVEAPKSISSDNTGNSQHMERRMQNPSNITNMPVISKLEDLDLFYSEVTPPRPAAAKRPLSTPAAQPAPQLEQIGLGGVGSLGPASVGTAVIGEDDESDEEDAESDAGSDDWKYCAQAAPAATAAPSAFQPPSREVAAPAAEASAAPTSGTAPAESIAAAPVEPVAPAESIAVAPVEPVAPAESAEPVAPAGTSAATPAASGEVAAEPPDLL